MTTRDKMVDLLTRQIDKCDMALTLESKEQQELQLLGMQKMLYEAVGWADYKMITDEAEKKARN